MPCAHDFKIIKDYPKWQEGVLSKGIDFKDKEFIHVDDDTLSDVMNGVSIKTINISGKFEPYLGLAWYGITLIPPESLGELINGILRNKNYNDSEVIQLLILLKKAKENNKYVLHCGV